MHITIKTTRHELTAETRSLVEEKFNALSKLVGGSEAPAQLACEIEESLAVERAGNKIRVEGNLSVDGKHYRAEAEGAGLEGTVDRVRDELVRQVQHTRGKKRGFMRRGGAAIKNLFRFSPPE